MEPVADAVFVESEAELKTLAGRIGKAFAPGDIVLLSGPLGAGKTTFVRGYLESLGHLGPVRSPTFNLIQVFDTSPPVAHADLYRVASAAGTGLAEYFDSHVCLIEWPDRLGSLVDPDSCWGINIEFSGAGRAVTLSKPT